MHKRIVYCIYVFAVIVGFAIAYFMTGCKSSQKCDAYSDTEYKK